jgi:hypothetical protein
MSILRYFTTFVTFTGWSDTQVDVNLGGCQSRSDERTTIPTGNRNPAIRSKSRDVEYKYTYVLELMIWMSNRKVPWKWKQIRYQSTRRHIQITVTLTLAVTSHLIEQLWHLPYILRETACNRTLMTSRVNLNINQADRWCHQIVCAMSDMYVSVSCDCDKSLVTHSDCSCIYVISKDRLEPNKLDTAVMASG